MSFLAPDIVLGGAKDVVLELRDQDGNGVNAVGTPTVTLKDGAGLVVVNAANMTLESGGVYVYHLQTATTNVAGTWRGTVDAVASTSTGNVTLRPEFRFSVAPA